MTFLRSSVFAIGACLLFVACGDSTTPPATDSGTRVDGNVTSDLGARDASSETDAQVADAQVADASIADAAPSDMCRPPRCPPIPPGCRVEASADPCICGEIKCDDGGIPGATCGGRATTPCGRGLFCDFGAAFDCGFADGMGTCAARPDFCIEIFAPVCGCDGMTYSNTCHAQSSGTDVQADGACETDPPPPPPPPGSDCRSTGCAAGSSCQVCRGGAHACIREGSAC